MNLLRVRPGGDHVTFDGNARTAFAENDVIMHVTEGWDVLPPKAGTGTWRGGY